MVGIDRFLLQQSRTKRKGLVEGHLFAFERGSDLLNALVLKPTEVASLDDKGSHAFLRFERNRFGLPGETEGLGGFHLLGKGHRQWRSVEALFGGFVHLLDVRSITLHLVRSFGATITAF